MRFATYIFTLFLCSIITCFCITVPVLLEKYVAETLFFRTKVTFLSLIIASGTTFITFVFWANIKNISPAWIAYNHSICDAFIALTMLILLLAIFGEAVVSSNNMWHFFSMLVTICTFIWIFAVHLHIKESTSN